VQRVEIGESHVLAARRAPASPFFTLR